MKIFFYMGRNLENKSGVSWKIWKIERIGFNVKTYWARAILVRRRVIPVGNFQSKTRKFRSINTASAFEAERIRVKIQKGYERQPKRRHNQ